jgi:hypothetical protein
VNDDSGDLAASPAAGRISCVDPAANLRATIEPSATGLAIDTTAGNARATLDPVRRTPAAGGRNAANALWRVPRSCVIVLVLIWRAADSVAATLFVILRAAHVGHG